MGSARRRLLSVALLQAYVDPNPQLDQINDPWSKKESHPYLRVYRPMTEEAARKGAHLIIWSESSLPFPLSGRTDAEKALEERVGNARRVLPGLPDCR